MILNQYDELAVTESFVNEMKDRERGYVLISYDYLTEGSTYEYVEWRTIRCISADGVRAIIGIDQEIAIEMRTEWLRQGILKRI